MIDFFGAGYVAAERLGLIPDLERIHFPIRRIEFADSQGRDKFGGLVGDACHCVSLVAGQGASLAMAGAYVLAEELSRGVLGVPGALKAYERRVKPGVERIQIAGRRIARWFVPQSWFGLAIRNGLTRVATWPLARNIVGASMADSILQ
jgi:2-polyprenyl-6-methoxyphenol hydroxylase-like FAD-dependent oxidoreductase